MNGHYERYDGASFNLIADAVTEGEILAILRDTVAQHGEAAVTGLILMREDGRYVEGSKRLSPPMLTSCRWRSRAARTSLPGTDSTGNDTTLRKGIGALLGFLSQLSPPA